MLVGVFNRTALPVLEEVVYFAQARHEVLAGNLANLDTPGYRTADLSPEVFQQRLREAIARRDAPPASAAAESPAVQDRGPGDPIRQVRDSIKSILRHDQSDVGLEQQVLAMTENQMTHNMAVALMNSQFHLLEAAVSERV